VPRNRVQHTDVSTGLIERAFELSTLVIYTAGTQHASVELSGLSQPTAQAIRDHLIEGGGVDGV
jgi:membrane protein YdbS with pleckstrin-like domain